jgi:leucyl/phenylalanyl-tRNA--protein transferase
VTWWSPDPRAILELDRFHLPRSLSKILRQNRFNITYNQAFAAVMAGCAESAPGRQTTWITRDFIQAYTKLHHEGHAYSIECWQGGDLVGGVYGVAIGGLFAGESMFHRISNASKVALFYLVQHLREQQFALFDIQMATPVTEQLGASTISRAEYLKRLEVAVNFPRKFVPS